MQRRQFTAAAFRSGTDRIGASSSALSSITTESGTAGKTRTITGTPFEAVRISPLGNSGDCKRDESACRPPTLGILGTSTSYTSAFAAEDDRTEFGDRGLVRC